jgi:hypothetical protein
MQGNMTLIVVLANSVGLRTAKGAKTMHIVIAPFRPKQGVTEDVMLGTSDDFDEQFVRKQDGILKRILVKDGEGGYADIVFFNDAAAIDRVIQAEQDSDVCAAFFALIDDEDHPHIYEALKTYD